WKRETARRRARRRLRAGFTSYRWNIECGGVGYGNRGRSRDANHIVGKSGNTRNLAHICLCDGGRGPQRGSEGTSRAVKVECPGGERKTGVSRCVSALVAGKEVGGGANDRCRSRETLRRGAHHRNTCGA